MPSLKDIYPTAKQLCDAPLLDLSHSLLLVLGTRLHSSRGSECAHNFLSEVLNDYDNNEHAALACSEAWTWLHSNGFICQNPMSDSPWMTLTRLGRNHYDQGIQLKSWIEDRQLPEDMIHLSLRSAALRLFRQELFDNAVFEAFKVLEVSVRQAAGLGDEWIGTKLTNRAFHPKDGPLTDKLAEPGEQLALMSLMSGAIGSYKNPQSHRHVGLQASEAREMIIMASHLLSIVESRRIT
ncbi:hypothetical protein D3C81_195130 [compost metagenome]